MIKSKPAKNAGINFFLLIAIAIFSGCPDKKENQVSLAIRSSLFSEMQQLRGSGIHSVTEKKYLVSKKDHDLQKETFAYSEEIIFPDSGNTILLKSYNEKGDLIWTRSCAFNGSNLNEILLDSADGKLKNKITYFYGEDGRLLEINEYNADHRPLYKTSYWFDQKKNTLIINDYACNFGAPETPPLTHFRKLTHTYDETGKIIETKFFSANDSLQSQSLYAYNDTGYIITETYPSQASDSTLLYPHTILQVFDNSNRLLEKTEYNSKDEIISRTTFKYEFDTAGRWVKKTEFFLLMKTGDQIPISITERIFSN